MLNRATLALAAALTALSVSNASAQSAGERETLQLACGGDYLRFCAGTDPGGPEVRACFRRNMRNLSPGCRSAINGYVGRNPRGGRRADDDED